MLWKLSLNYYASKNHSHFHCVQFKIRREAMSGLAMIYKNHLMDSDVPEATKKAVTWIKDKILHCYYMPGLDDK